MTTPQREIKFTKDMKRKPTVYMLNKNQLKIFNAIMKSFPKTDKLSAMDFAIQGGAKFNFISK